MASDIERAFPSRVAGPVEQRWVRWLPTLQNCVVVNVDESVNGSPRRGWFGGCICGFEGAWIAGFDGFRDDPDILLLELLDSLHVVVLVKYTPSSRHVYAPLIWDIKDLLSRSWRMELVHTIQEGNACADFLAKFGVAQAKELVELVAPSDGLRPFLLANAMGASFLRP
ncbi:uncharacterized protein LOC130737208 [Lotus japonicus]|uniref:uncharacterized protein LOC130737208 n=1 Tax=Lotus japonicus TaxID=34305 RepID=UPI002586B122|nr:uncharacterized protein LOC130737208 [Lotus japonicus]